MLVNGSGFPQGDPRSLIHFRQNATIRSLTIVLGRILGKWKNWPSH